ncbi:hypothetical protein OIU85_003077 [Salix viminalis]|uniref:Uncharacterized protein n=1 Tax=Salix viminalis TaxID=40686 RepID=A0A9Q0PYF9_SALVM|nr:hypothetical protein OIU85_003077 [Salix viminalis]
MYKYSRPARRYFFNPCLLLSTQAVLIGSVDRSPSGTMSKTLMVFGLTVMVVCACFAGVPTVAGTNSPSPVIGYGAIGKGGNPGCSPNNPKACNRVPANPYHRGCEKEEHCRNGGGRKLLGEGIQANAPIHFI